MHSTGMFPFHKLPSDMQVHVAEFLSLRDAERWCIALNILHVLAHARHVARQRRRMAALERVLCYQASRHDMLLAGMDAGAHRRLAACLHQLEVNVKQGRPTMLYESHPLVDGAPMLSLFLAR